ncbi:hypothetical protein J7I93_16450 [Bacillus sp. ISL-47]|uniref:hypothetical protein n=1 Tax=Bacillus sp. ISL-47 TaxID=2819130 RepID=UPI001BE9AD63|nr:hypothetical protein [Bacillus sp. ISL-47]MBT2689779.1 hypothetical protein [Bacillus sp. ISL-47]MBT2709225.1 hypothetical protein [Pseudomonas sp. ISL-84]
MQHLMPVLILTRGVILLTLALSYMLYSFFSLPLDLFLVSLVVIAFLISLPWMAVFPKVMSAALLVFGNMIFFLYGGNVEYWIASILNNVALVSLFITVPLLSYPLKNGGYIEYMDYFVVNFLKKDMKRIAFVTAITCIVSSFLNLGSLRVMYDLFSVRFKYLNKVFVRSLVQGFSLAAFWSPYFAGVAIILHLVGVSFVSFFGYGLVMVIICYLTSVVINLRFLSKEVSTNSAPYVAVSLEEDGSKKQTKKVEHKRGIELIIAFIGLFLALFFLEKWLHYNVLLLISILAISYSIVWSLAINKIKEFAFSLKNYFTEVAPNVHTESIMIISATFFSQMVLLTEFPAYLSSLFSSISEISLILTVITIILTCVISSFFIHQVLPISIFATTLSPDVIGLKPELYVLILVISWGITPLLSPVSAANLLASALFKTKPFEIGIWNIKYALSVILVSSVSIYLINMFV